MYQYNNLNFLKKDAALILTLLFITIFMIYRILSLSITGDKLANVYLDGFLIDVLDLNVNQVQTYDGALGDVIVEVKSGKIAVIEETSPQNLCSLQGFVSSNLTPIICLPNNLIIEIVSSQSEYGLDVIQ